MSRKQPDTHTHTSAHLYDSAKQENKGKKQIMTAYKMRKGVCVYFVNFVDEC